MKNLEFITSNISNSVDRHWHMDFTFDYFNLNLLTANFVIIIFITIYYSSRNGLKLTVSLQIIVQ